MRFVRELLRALEEGDLYPDTIIVEEVPYPELVVHGQRYLCLCSNNYLGLSIHPEVKRAAIEGVERYGIGTCESRVTAGNLLVLEELEQAIADFKQAEAAMVFLSGFTANIGIIPAVMDSFDFYGFSTINNSHNLIICDMLNHLSIHDGCRLAKSPTKSYLHKDMNHLERILKRNRDKRKMIITDGVFSMDGDLAPLPQIIELARKYEAMVMIDDAHATGVIGENGRGTPEHFGVEGEVDIVMGTLSKAIGALGGFVTSTPEVIKLLKGRAHTYVYTSSLPPEQACAIMAAIKIIQTNPNLRTSLWRNVNQMRNGLRELGFDMQDSQTQIIPVIIGEEKKCIEAARLLFKKRIIAPPMISPVVPRGKARIRISLTALHSESQINMALDAFGAVGKEIGVI
jgi:glycine C-acetyltransferase